jgi:hypothetical protein
MVKMHITKHSSTKGHSVYRKYLSIQSVLSKIYLKQGDLINIISLKNKQTDGQTQTVYTDREQGDLISLIRLKR